MKLVGRPVYEMKGAEEKGHLKNHALFCLLIERAWEKEDN